MNEVLKNGQKYRAYSVGNIYVTADGKSVLAYKWENKQPSPGDELPILTRKSGHKYVEVTMWNKKVEVSVAEAVATCYCYKPKDGKEYELHFIDGDPKNCHKKNLKWVVKP